MGQKKKLANNDERKREIDSLTTAMEYFYEIKYKYIDIMLTPQLHNTYDIYVSDEFKNLTNDSNKLQ